MALTDGLNDYYAMEEATGASRIDSVGGLDLTDHNSVVQVTGEHNFGSGYTAASTQYLSHVHNSKFSVDTSQNGFSIGFWFYPTVAGVQGIMSKGFVNGGSQLEWQFIQNNPSGGMVFYMSYDGSSVIAAAPGNLPTFNAWNYVLGWWDKANATVNCRLNCFTPAASAFSPNTPFVGTGDFNVGRIFNNFATYGTFRIDELGIWNRLLTSEEQTLLCDGAVYPFTSPVAISFDAPIEFSADFLVRSHVTSSPVTAASPHLQRPYLAREITRDFTVPGTDPLENQKRSKFWYIYGKTGQKRGTVLGEVYFWSDRKRCGPIPIIAGLTVRRPSALFETGVPEEVVGRELFVEIRWFTNDVETTKRGMDLIELN